MVSDRWRQRAVHVYRLAASVFAGLFVLLMVGLVVTLGISSLNLNPLIKISVLSGVLGAGTALGVFVGRAVYPMCHVTVMRILAGSAFVLLTSITGSVLYWVCHFNFWSAFSASAIAFVLYFFCEYQFDQSHTVATKPS
jgi:hypothetical protein